MGVVMRNRGPDDEGFYFANHIALVHRRLSIRDLSPAGRCPMASSDGNIQVILNGEIYNWRELRAELESIGCQFKTQSDTEVIVKGYEVWNDAIVSRMSGMFAIAIWDNKARRLLLTRDRMGEKPLFYRLSKEGLVFASSIDAIASVVADRSIDPVAIASYLSHSFIPSRCTVWRDVEVLQPSHMLSITVGDEPEVRRYWELPRSGPIRRSLKYSQAGIEKVIDDSTRRCLDADVPVGIFLSGGVDSSVIAAFASRHDARLPAFSLGFKEASYSEIPYAEKVAHHLGMPHHILEMGVEDVISCLPNLVREYGQPFGDASAVPTFLVSRFARKHVTICLSGDGGDELFGGYWRMQASVYAARYARVVPKYVRQKIVPQAASRLGAIGARWKAMNELSLVPSGCGYTNSLSWWNLLHEIAGPNLRSIITSDIVSLRVSNHQDRAEASDVQRALLDDMQVQLPDAYLTKVDVASMAASLEVRSPFLEQNVIEKAWVLSDRFKLHFGQRKWLLKKIAAGFVPREVIYRRKMGFAMPLTKWFQSDLGDYLDNLMTSSVADSEGWILAPVVRKLLREHRTGEDHKTRLWLALWLELWFRFKEGSFEARYQ